MLLNTRWHLPLLATLCLTSIPGLVSESQDTTTRKNCSNIANKQVCEEFKLPGRGADLPSANVTGATNALELTRIFKGII